MASTRPPRRGAATAGRPVPPIPGSNAPAPIPKVDPIIALFRRECAHMLQTPLLPPTLSAEAHNALVNQPIEVLAAMERISTNGSQQSVQICRVGGDTGETWVTRTEGERRFFPVVGRVSKRGRSPPPVEEQDESAQGGGDADMDHDGLNAEPQQTPAAKRRTRRPTARATTSRTTSNTHDDEQLPPQAPKKARRAPRPVAEDVVSEDEGHQTEREGSARRSARISGRSKAKGKEVAVKKERTAEVDDLESLCGRVGGLGMGEYLQLRACFSLLFSVQSTELIFNDSNRIRRPRV